MDPVVILGTDVVSVGPGQEQRLPVRVRNQGRRVESYRVDVVGVPAQFAEVTPRQVSVLPGREAELDVMFRPPGGASTPTGTLPFAVRATSEVDASSSAVAEGRLELAGVAGLQAWAQETSAPGGGRRRTTSSSPTRATPRCASRLDRARSGRGDADQGRPRRRRPDGRRASHGGRRGQGPPPVPARHPCNRTLQADCQTFAFGAERPVAGGVPPDDDPNHRTFQLTFQQKPILPRFLAPAARPGRRRRAGPRRVDVAQDDRRLASTSPTRWRRAPCRRRPAVRTRCSSAGRRCRTPRATRCARRASTTSRPRRSSLRSCRPTSSRSPSPSCNRARSTATSCAPSVRTATTRASRSSSARPRARRPACRSPRDVAIVPAGGDNYTVSWTYDGPASQDLMFSVLVAGTEAATQSVQHRRHRAGVGGRGAAGRHPGAGHAGRGEVGVQRPRLVHDPGAAARTDDPRRRRRCRASGDHAARRRRGRSRRRRRPRPPPTTPTTAAATTTTTPSPAAIDELQDLQLTWVAMLGSVPPGSSGGVPLEARKARLAADFGVPVEQLDVFTNRDTVAKQPDGSSAQANEGSASSRYVYLATPDQATADAICAKAAGCEVLAAGRGGAGVGGQQGPAARPLPATATIADARPAAGHPARRSSSATACTPSPARTTRSSARPAPCCS